MKRGKYHKLMILFLSHGYDHHLAFANCLFPCVTPSSTSLVALHHRLHGGVLQFPYLYHGIATLLFPYTLPPSPNIPSYLHSISHFLAFSYSFLIFMAPLLCLLILMITTCSVAQGPPSPGFSPSSKFSPISFNQGFRNLWGSQHQTIDQGLLTIWLDSTSGTTTLFFFFPLLNTAECRP